MSCIYLYKEKGIFPYGGRENTRPLIICSQFCWALHFDPNTQVCFSDILEVSKNNYVVVPALSGLGHSLKCLIM